MCGFWNILHASFCRIQSINFPTHFFWITRNFLCAIVPYPQIYLMGVKSLAICIIASLLSRVNWPNSKVLLLQTVFLQKYFNTCARHTVVYKCVVMFIWAAWRYENTELKARQRVGLSALAYGLSDQQRKAEWQANIPIPFSCSLPFSDTVRPRRGGQRTLYPLKFLL